LVTAAENTGKKSAVHQLAGLESGDRQPRRGAAAGGGILIEIGRAVEIVQGRERCRRGSTGSPARTTSKCTCGPVLRPVEPMRAMTSPFSTFSPTDTRFLRLCA